MDRFLFGYAQVLSAAALDFTSVFLLLGAMHVGRLPLAERLWRKRVGSALLFAGGVAILLVALFGLSPFGAL